MTAPNQPPDDPKSGESARKDPSTAPSPKTVLDVSWTDISLSDILKSQSAAEIHLPDNPTADKPSTAIPGLKAKSFADLSLDDLLPIQPSATAIPPAISESIKSVPDPGPREAAEPPAVPKPAAVVVEKVKEVAVNPEAMLIPRKKDIQIPLDKLVAFRDCIGLFTQLKSKPSVEKWPGTLVLRRYHPGEVVCRQGEAGDTAFYIITASDEERLRAARILESTRTLVDLEVTAEALGVHLAIARSTNRPTGWVERLASRFTKRGKVEHQQPKFIPIDAPVGVDYESRRASLSAGELFGEMSCLYRTPRSATVVAERDCYVLEMLRNVLDQLKKDPKFKEEMDRKYKERVFGLQVRNLPLFRDLPEDVIAWLRDRATLKSYRCGQIIFDEHDRPDGLVIIRNGLVKVCQGVSCLLSVHDIVDWPGLLTRMQAAANESVLGQLREHLVRLAEWPANAPQPLPDNAKQAIVFGLNDLIKGQPLAEIEKQQQPGPLYLAMVGTLPKATKDRTDQDLRRLNRTFLDEQLASLIRPRRLAAGPESILSYMSRGELIGEIGVVNDCPRTASCIASTHLRFGQAKEDVKSTEEEFVEVVQLTAAVFRELLTKPEAAPVRQQVESLIAARRQADAQRQSLTTASATRTLTRRISPEFERLGLIQGTRLMLIDLDRCTRCDECVRACADTHDDGRSRLFLEGPRFEHYLVPITCRSCLDPVCLIGCPVGSIHRGDNKEIRIEDWCIGCGLCARQCPYGSIQMHDVGIIASGARGWRYCGDTGRVDPTRRPRLDGWRLGSAPFRKSRDFRAAVGPATSFWFAMEFDVPRDLLCGYSMEVELTAPDPAAQIYLNGAEVQTTERLKRDKRLFPIAQPKSLLRSKGNLVMVRTTPKPEEEGTVFDLRLDAIPMPVRATDQPVEYSEKAVTSRAVVCDLCSNLPGQVPSCVHACPHDAAMRVDALTNFPAR